MKKVIQLLYFHSWSGGKDSTASVILNHIHELPPSRILFSEVMFDKNRGISGELPEHIDFVKNKAIPLFRSWGYEVEILHADKDYLDLFYRIITKSKISERNGKLSGWLIGGMCAANDRLKIKPIRDFLRNIKEDYIQYNGIAIDEPKRLAKLENTNRVSLLEKYNYTEQMAYDLCKKYDLLSPTYEISKRGGCWFCPNQRYKEFAHLKQFHPELWNELKLLSFTENLASQGFRYGETFSEVEEKIDCIIQQQNFQKQQLTLF